MRALGTHNGTARLGRGWVVLVKLITHLLLDPIIPFLDIYSIIFYENIIHNGTSEWRNKLWYVDTMKYIAPKLQATMDAYIEERLCDSIHLQFCDR